LQRGATTHTPMNIVEFKMMLVEDLVLGRSIDNLFEGEGGRRRAAHPCPRQRWATVAVCILCINV
jgi:hypothetical protein